MGQVSFNFDVPVGIMLCIAPFFTFKCHIDKKTIKKSSLISFFQILQTIPFCK